MTEDIPLFTCPDCKGVDFILAGSINIRTEGEEGLMEKHICLSCRTDMIAKYRVVEWRRAIAT